MVPYNSLSAVQQELRLGTLTISSIVSNYLHSIEANKHLNSFIEVFEEDSINRATLIDNKLHNSQAGKLAGLVIGVKDLISISDQNTSGASKILEGYRAPFNATSIEKILNEDAIIIGRNNCDEFGMGSTNESSAFGPVLNPVDTSRVPGGSSGGSAAAVKAGMCHVSIGTDTGGSVRQPAAFCDVIGFKPTYSRISRYGLLAYASSFDTIGVLGNTIYDIAITLNVMAGFDSEDSTSSSKEVPDYRTSDDSMEPKRILVFNEAMNHPSLNNEIRKRTLSTLSALKSEGHLVEFVDFSMMDYVLPTYYILTAAEASSNLARYDGVKFGKRTKSFNDLESMYVNTRTEGFGTEVIRRIILGTFVLSASYFDAFYSKAQRIRSLIETEIDEYFKDYDFILLPTTPSPPYKIGEMDQDPLEMYLADLYTVIASLTGNPAISIPNGYTNDNLPVGLQLIANDFNEKELLAFSDYILSLRQLDQ